MRRPLRHKLFINAALGIGLLAVTMSILVHNTVRHEVQRNEDQELQQTQFAFEALQNYQRNQLIDKCRLVSEIPHLRAATSVLDPEADPEDQGEALATVLDVAQKVLEQTEGVDLLVITNAQGTPLVAAGPVARSAIDELDQLEPVARRSLGGAYSEEILFLEENLVRVVAVPMLIGDNQLGSLSLGSALDSGMANSLEDMSGSAIALYGKGILIAKSESVPQGAEIAIQDISLNIDLRKSAGIQSEVAQIDGVKYRTLWVPLTSTALSQPYPTSFVVMRSEDRALAFLAEVRRGLIGITLFAVFVGMLVSFGMARQMTTPIQRLVEHTDRLASGDLSSRVSVRTQDELALLGDAFNRMGSRLQDSLNHLEETNAALENRSQDLAERNLELRKSKEETEAVNRALQETHAQLVQAGKMAAFGELGASIAHELRQPLTAIRALAQIMGFKLDKEDTVLKRHTDTIIESVDHMTSIMQNLRDFARKSSFNSEAIQIPGVLDRTAKLMDAQFRTRKIKLTMDLETTAPAVMGDANQLQQVFTNLLGNARDALGEEGGHIHVATRLLGGDSYLMVSVRDNGAGIPSEHLSQIFKSFFTTKPEGEGTGLGLSITQGIVKDHGGRVEVVSKEGEGTTFRIFLPTVESKPCWEFIDCVKDCRPDIESKEQCVVFQENRGHRCWETLGQLAQNDKSIPTPSCEYCPVHMAKNDLLISEARPDEGSRHADAA